MKNSSHIEVYFQAELMIKKPLSERFKIKNVKFLG